MFVWDNLITQGNFLKTMNLFSDGFVFEFETDIIELLTKILIRVGYESEPD